MHRLRASVIDRIAHMSVSVNAILGEPDGLLLPHWIPDDGLDNFSVRAGEVFFLMDTGYLVAIIFNEPVQALNSGILLVISSEVKNLAYRAIIPDSNLGLNIGSFLG